MKFVVFLFALSSPVQADLVARFHTTQGNVDVVLQFETAPQAVANFITLAQGSRPWVDPLNGSIRSEPFYNGTKIHRTANDGSFKFAQGGSLKGDGSDGPGYTFRDEFDSPLIHEPYVLSMANAGPNTNGSQFFFTGSLPQPTFNKVHTIFGLVTDPASRGVVDTMITAGPNGTTINEVTFTRTDPAALAFDEFAQNLPICSGIAGHLEVSMGSSTDYMLNSPLPEGAVFQAYRSVNMQSWSKLGEIYQGYGESETSDITLDGATLPKAFYQLPLIRYPDALAPASLSNRTLIMGLYGSQTITFQFDATGEAGTATYSETPEAPTPIIGVSYTPSPYKATWIIETVQFNPIRTKGILNVANSTQVLGTNVSEQWNGSFWGVLSSGFLELSK